MVTPNKIIAKMANHVPSMYSGSVLLNALGMQFARIGFFHLRRVARKPATIAREYRHYLTELEQNGAAIIPDFFPEDDFARLKEEFHTLTPEFKSTNVNKIDLPHVDRMSIHHERVSDATRNLFLGDPLLKAIPAGYLNRPYNLPLKAYLTTIHCDREEIDLPQNGGTNNVHFDAPTRALKAFYYVSDADEKNAALFYCIGSNRRDSLKRWLLEYKLSIRYALNRWNPHHHGEYFDNEPWVKITPAEMAAAGLEESVLRVRANSMVFVDIGGFHRRGGFLEPGVRETIEVNFRDAETLKNDFAFLR